MRTPAITLAFAATGLPAGFTMSPAGVITGTATATTGSPFTVTVSVTDSRGAPVTRDVPAHGSATG